MTNDVKRFLAVIDPTRIEQWALQRAVSIAQGREDATVHALVCVYAPTKCDEPAELQAAEIRRHSLWLDEIINEYSDSGVTITPIVEWHKDWREATAKIARTTAAELVVKRASGRPNSLASSDRQLIRSLKNALLLVKHDPSRKLDKLLVAVDFNATSKSHTDLNSAIMDLGKSIRGTDQNMELHCVSAYPDSDKFVHPPDVAKKLGIDRSRAHVVRGKAADVIPESANSIGAALVIVGTVGRRGLSGITVGNTAEKILADIHSDVLVLVQEETAMAPAA